MGNQLNEGPCIVHILRAGKSSHKCIFTSLPVPMAISRLHDQSKLRVPDIGPDTDASDQDASAASDANRDDKGSFRSSPALFHKVQNQRSILSLVASDSSLFAGTQGGEILVCSVSH